MDIDSQTGTLTRGAYAGEWNDSSGWVRVQGLLVLQQQGKKQTDKVDGTTRAEDGLRNQKDWAQSCGLELKERQDGNVTGLMALSIK